MRKVFTLFFVALCSLSIFGNTYWYRGELVSESWGAAAMTISEDGFYEYYTLTQGGSFKITTGADSWNPAYGSSKLRTGFNGTDFTANNTGVKDIHGWESGDTENLYAVSNEGTWYVMIYYPNTTVNPGTDPIICASSTLPTNPKYYITGNAALVGESAAWNEKAIEANSDTYTFTNLAAGEYQLVVLPTGRWDDNITRRYEQLTDKSNAGLTGDNDDNICFRLTSAANVTVTYTGTVFTVTTDGAFFHLANGYYLQKAGQEVHELYSTPFVEHKSGEWKLSTSLTEGDQIKVVTVESNAIVYKFPNNDNFYTVDSDHDGSVNIYFTNNYKEDWAAFGGYIYVEQDKGTALDNTVDDKKAVKRIVDGQLVIEREGKRFNALGAEVK